MHLLVESELGKCPRLAPPSLDFPPPFRNVASRVGSREAVSMRGLTRRGRVYAHQTFREEQVVKPNMTLFWLTISLIILTSWSLSFPQKEDPEHIKSLIGSQENTRYSIEVKNGKLIVNKTKTSTSANLQKPGPFWNSYNPFCQPFNTTDYYGSGDVDGDGHVTNIDVQLVQRIIDGLDPCTARADVNGHGSSGPMTFQLFDGPSLAKPAWLVEQAGKS